MVMAMRGVLMAMTTARRIGSGLGLKRLIDVLHDEVHRTQHLSQHVIGLDLQMVRLQLDRYMAVAEVVRGTHQIEGSPVRRVWRYPQHSLGRCKHPHQRAIVGDQYIAPPYNGAAWQEHSDRTPFRIRGFETALLPHIPIELYRCSTPDQHRRKASTLGHEFVGNGHQSLVIEFEGKKKERLCSYGVYRLRIFNIERWFDSSRLISKQKIPLGHGQH
jgi:hypothetical protein